MERPQLYPPQTPPGEGIKGVGLPRPSCCYNPGSDENISTMSRRYRMRSNLELLVLALVRHGLETPYDLKAKADVSLGSSIPVLNRMEAEGLLKVTKPQARRSRRFTITPKGAQVLKHEWTEVLDDPTNDPEAILRIAYLVWLNGSSQNAAAYLYQAADRLKSMAAVTKAQCDRFGSRGPKVDHDAMRWLRCRVAGSRLLAEAKELQLLGEELGKRQPGERTLQTRKGKKQA